MKEIIIKQNPKRFLSLLIGGLFLLTGGIIIILEGEDLIFILLGIFAILFFGFGIFVIIMRYITNKYLLLINEEGFINNSYMNTKKLGLIPWEKVDLIYTRTMYSNYCIYVDIKNLDELYKERSVKKLKLFKNSVVILLQSKKEQQETFKVMMEYYNAYHKRQEV